MTAYSAESNVKLRPLSHGLLIVGEIVIRIDHPFFADAESGNGLAFAFVEHGGDAQFGGLPPGNDIQIVETHFPENLAPPLLLNY